MTGLAPSHFPFSQGLGWAHPAHIRTGTGLTPPHLHRDRAHPAHIRTGTGRTLCPHLHRDRPGAPARAIGPERASISRVKLCAEAFAARMALIAAHVRFICASATPRLPNDWTKTA